MVAALAKIRKAILAGVYAGAGVYAALSAVPGINPYVQLGASIGAGFVGGFIVFETRNEADTSAASSVPASGVKPPPV